MKNTYTHKKNFLFIFVSFLFISFSPSSFAQITHTWTGASNSSWTNALNWNPSTIPGASDSVIFDATSTVICSEAGAVTIGSLTISGAQDITLSGGLTVTGDYSQSGGTVNLSGGVVSVAGLTVNNATLNATGSTSIVVGTTFSLQGAAAFTSTGGNLTVTNDFIKASGATFTPNAGKVILTQGAGTTIISDGCSFFDLTIAPTATTGTKTLEIGASTSDSITVNNNLVITSGAGDLNLPINLGIIDLKKDLDISGHNGTGTGGGTATISLTASSAAQQITGNTINSGKLPGITIQQTGGVTLSDTINISGKYAQTSDDIVTVSSGGAVTVTDSMIIRTGGVFDASLSAFITVSTLSVQDTAQFYSTTPGDLTVNNNFTIAGTALFTPGSGKVILKLESVTTTVSNGPFYNLTLSPTANSGTRNLTVDNPVNVNNNLVINSSGSLSLRINDGIINVSKNLDVSGHNGTAAVVQGTATITLNGSTAQQIIGNSTAGNGKLPFIIINNTDTLTLSGTISTDQNFIYTSGTVAPGTSTLAFYGVTDLDFENVTNMNVNNIIINGTNTLASPMVVNGNLTLNSTLNTNIANNYGITILGNWINSGIFTANNSTVTFNGITTITGTPDFKHILINSGKTLISPSQLNVIGNFTNHGIFTHSNGTVILKGTGIQTISGSAVTNFYNINVTTATAAVTLSSAQNLLNTLTLTDSSATFATGGFLTLVSTSALTARIADLPTPGNFTGNITMQRLAPGGNTGWAFLGSPVSGKTLADWGDDFATTGFTGSTDTNYYNFTSVYYYDETINGGFDEKTLPATNITNSIGTGQGWWIYLGNQTITTTDIMIDVSGTPHKGDINLPVFYNSIGGADTIGWNLVSNPYPSQIDWDNGAWVKTNMNNEIHIYNADLNNGDGGYATYINNVSNPAEGSGGIANIIPSSQGFYVRANLASPVLTAKETVKTGTSSAFRSGERSQPYPLFRLFVDGGSRHDEMVILFKPEASADFDPDHDAHKLTNANVQSPNICSKLISGNLLCINSMPELNQDFSIPVRLTVGISGTYTISPNDIQNIPGSSCIMLEDLLTGSLTDLKAGNSYTFSISDTTDAPRFMVHVTKPMEPSLQQFNATCNAANDGIFIANPDGQGPFTYTWKDNAGQVIQTHTNLTGADTLRNLGAGIYSVTINNTCGDHTEIFSINQPPQVNAAFTMSESTVDMSSEGYVEFYNNSIEATGFIWNFGDNGSVSTLSDPTHNYNSAGNYTVTLIANNNTCSIADTTFQIITVTDVNAGILQNPVNENIFVFSNRDGVFVQFALDQPENTVIKVYNLPGQKVSETVVAKAHNQMIKLDIPDNNTAVYFINITNEQKNINKKIIR